MQMVHSSIMECLPRIVLERVLTTVTHHSSDRSITVISHSKDAHPGHSRMPPRLAWHLTRTQMQCRFLAPRAAVELSRTIYISSITIFRHLTLSSRELSCPSNFLTRWDSQIFRVLRLRHLPLLLYSYLPLWPSSRQPWPPPCSSGSQGPRGASATRLFPSAVWTCCRWAAPFTTRRTMSDSDMRAM